MLVLASALAAAAGGTDVAAFTRLGGVFTSVMTGNLTLLGLAAATTSAQLAAHIGVAVGGYATGVALGSRVGRLTGRRRALWPPSATAILGIETIAFLGITAGWEASHSAPAGNLQLILLAVATAAMGLQTRAMRDLRIPLSTTYLTGTLTTVVASLTTGRREEGIRLGGAVLVAHVLGAAAAGGLILAAPALVPVVPAVLLAGVVAAVATTGVSAQPR